MCITLRNVAYHNRQTAFERHSDAFHDGCNSILRPSGTVINISQLTGLPRSTIGLSRHKDSCPTACSAMFLIPSFVSCFSVMNHFLQLHNQRNYFCEQPSVDVERLSFSVLKEEGPRYPIRSKLGHQNNFSPICRRRVCRWD